MFLFFRTYDIRNLYILQGVLICFLHLQQNLMHPAIICGISGTKSIFFQAPIYFHRHFCSRYYIKQGNVFRLFCKGIATFYTFTGSNYVRFFQFFCYLGNITSRNFQLACQFRCCDCFTVHS